MIRSRQNKGLMCQQNPVIDAMIPEKENAVAQKDNIIMRIYVRPKLLI